MTNSYRDNTDALKEKICEWCSDAFYNGAVNSSPHHLCEGIRCAEAEEGYFEDMLETEDRRDDIPI